MAAVEILFWKVVLWLCPRYVWRLLQRLRGAGSICLGVDRRSDAGFVQEMVHLDLGLWMMVGGPGGLRRRRCLEFSGQQSKECGDVPRPTTHNDMRDVVHGGARFEAHNAAWLLWHFLGSWYLRGLSSPSPTDAMAMAPAVGIDDNRFGGYKDSARPYCKISFFWLFSVNFHGVLSGSHRML